MLNFLLTLAIHGWPCVAAPPAPRDAAFRDPLSHPDLARMDQRALADLQFRPERVAPI